jgi:hypothetical protein
MTSPEALLGSKPNRYLAQQEKVPRRRHAPGALPGGATGGSSGRGLVVLWRLGLGAGGAESNSTSILSTPGLILKRHSLMDLSFIGTFYLNFILVLLKEQPHFHLKSIQICRISLRTSEQVLAW